MGCRVLRLWQVSGPAGRLAGLRWMWIWPEVFKQVRVESVAGGELVVPAARTLDDVREVVYVPRRRAVRRPAVSGDPASKTSQGTHDVKPRSASRTTASADHALSVHVGTSPSWSVFSSLPQALARSIRKGTRRGQVDIINVHGGAIALGHPIGMSGARIALHLALELKRRGSGVGAAALCGGGGQGDALILHVSS